VRAGSRVASGKIKISSTIIGLVDREMGIAHTKFDCGPRVGDPWTETPPLSLSLSLYSRASVFAGSN